MSQRAPRRQRCRTCKKLRPVTSFYRRRGKPRVCRVCARLASLRRQGRDDLVQLVRDFEHFDTELHAALAPYWPQLLLRAREGVYA
jgi:hypothetical protein